MAAKYRAINRRIYRAEMRLMRTSRRGGDVKPAIAKVGYYERQHESRFNTFEQRECEYAYERYANGWI